MTSQGGLAGSCLPSAHIVQAALRVAQLVGSGSLAANAQSSYLVHQSDAMYPPCDLQEGEKLLLRCGWLIRDKDRLVPTTALALAARLDGQDRVVALLLAVLRPRADATNQLDQLPVGSDELVTKLVVDAEARERIPLAAGRTYDDAANRVLGAKGEELIVELSRRQLLDLGRADLAEHVVRVSETSDQLGYDVVAPRLLGSRRMEVKATSRAGGGLVTFFLSRNEIEWGLRDPDWALVVCAATVDQLSLLGFCRAVALAPYLPSDSASGNWVSAQLVVPRSLLKTGLPSAV